MKHRDKRSIRRIVLWPFRSYIRILIVFGIIALYQYQSFRIDMLARELRQLELKKATLSNETNALKVKIDQLTHINRVEKLARQRYGLYLGGSDFERLVIKPYQDKQNDEWEKDKAIHMAGVH
jgi:cell division protein FtsB